eukprot:s727_g3.t1
MQEECFGGCADALLQSNGSAKFQRISSCNAGGDHFDLIVDAGELAAVGFIMDLAKFRWDALAHVEELLRLIFSSLRLFAEPPSKSRLRLHLAPSQLHDFLVAFVTAFGAELVVQRPNGWVDFTLSKALMPQDLEQVLQREVYEERSHERYAQVLFPALGHAPRVLDVGGGDGHMAQWWSREGCEVHLLEVDAKLVAEAQMRLGEGKFYRFKGQLPKDTTIVLIVQAAVPEPRTLQRSEVTRCFPKPCVGARNLTHVAEVCSGIGCLGVGLEESGFQVRVRSDWNQSMLDLSQKIHSTPTLRGDVTTDSLLADLSDQFPDVGGLAAGVSCQPYSRLGDQKQDQDIRAQTFPAVLRMTFLGQYGFAILECVKEAGGCAWIQKLLQQFSTETGYHVSQEIYHLQHVWPTRRSRWWCVVSHPSIGPIHLHPSPAVSPRPMIAHVLPGFQECDFETLRQLQLDLYELGGVMGFEANKRARTLPARPTPMTQTTNQVEEKSQSLLFPATPKAPSASSPDDTKTTDYYVKSPTSAQPEHSEQELLTTEPGDTCETTQENHQDALKQGGETMVIFVKHEDCRHPIPYTVASDMTVRKLTHAEAKLGSFSIPVVPRSLVGTHVPLDAEMHSNQYVLLHQQMPPTLRCPFVSSKFSGQPQSIDLKLPCTRFEALWRQQAWVATDEMDYYLEAVQMEDKALPFPTSVFLNESEAAEWAHEWLAVAMMTNATDKPWCSAAIVDGHWIPIVIQHDQNVIQVSTTPEGNCFVPQVHAIAHRQGKAVQFHQKILPQAFAADCGFQALAWVIALVNDLKVEPLPPCKASQWRHLFVRELCRNNRGHDLIHQLAVGGSAPVTTDTQQTMPPQADMPTVTVPRQFAQIEVRTAGQTFRMFGEVGIGILDVLKCLTDESIPTIRAVTVQDELLGQVPLQESRSLTPQGIILFVDSPCQMLLSEQDVIASNWPVVVVLHSLGILILKRQAGFMCYDVETAVESFDFEWEAPLLDYTGNRMIEDSIAPNIVFLGTTAKVLDFWEMLRHPIAFRDLAQGFVTCIPQNQVHAFIHWIEKIGVHALVRSCGWQFLTQLNQEPPTVPLEVYLLPCADRFPVAPRALCQLVIERIFINQLKFHATNPMLGENVRVSLKLWRTWVWTGQIGDGENTQFIHQAWLLAHRFFGDSTPIRLVSQGNQLNPDWPISHYVQTTGTGEKILKIHAVLQMHGGGPSPEQPPRTIHEAYSFQELENLEQADANRLISILIQNLVEVPADEQHMDLEVIRSSTLRQDGPSFTMVGSVSTVIRFMRDLSATGIEALLRAMGWVTAMSISDSRPPVQVQLHLMPKAGVRHLAQTTVRSFLAHALTIRAMPIPGGANGDITVKVKLADSWVLVGKFPPEVRMSIFIDPWYQATSFFGQPTRLRIICNSAQVNPDRCLEEYTRTNELGERFAKLFLVLQLQGGGPKETNREDTEDSPSEKPMQTILLTVPRDGEHRLVRMHPEAYIREALAQIRPGEPTDGWIPRDSFGFPYDWDMQIQDTACIHFMRRLDNPDETNGLLFFLHHQAKTGVQEIEFYLRLHAAESTYKPISPICITAARGSHVRHQQLRQWLEDLLEHAMASGRPVASLCLVDQHWIPFVAHVSFDILQVQTTMAGMDLLPQIERCCRRPHQPMPHSPPLWLRLPVNFMTRQSQVIFPHDCGFQAIVWLMNHICTRRPTEPLTMSEALQWRNRYLQHLACWDAASMFRIPMTLHLGGAETDPAIHVEPSLGQAHEQSSETESARIPHGSEVCSCISIWGETAEHVQTTPNHEALGMYDAWIGARLCAKSYNQLRNMPAPNPINDEQLEAVRECLMNKDHRVQLLRHQDNLWADDEVLYHLQAITAMTGSDRTQVLDPLLARARALQEPKEMAEIHFHSPRVVTALHFQSHWTPVIFDKQGNFLNIHTLAQPNPKTQVLESLAYAVQMSMGCTASRWILYHTRDAPNDSCGILTIALAGHVLLRLPLPHGAEQVMQLGHMLRKRFSRNLPEFCGLPYLWATGLSGAKHDPELLQQLASLLKDHGVWADRTIDRATTLLESIPLSTIRSVVQSKRPWTDLKHAANQAKPPIKLIQQDELDAQIANRALHRNQFGRKPNKTQVKRSDPPKEPFTISASALEVPPGVFKQQDGTLLGPLRADQIGPNSEGVVLVDQADSHAALKLPRPVTQKGLAVLVLANKENSTMHEGDPIRFPAMCTTTQEPLIAAGYLYQMGTQAVQRNEPQNKLAVDERNTEAIRCIVFSDQAGAMWDDVLTHPVRTIFAQEALLRPQGPEDSPVIDVWDRQWVTKRYEKTKAKGADMFLFSFRMLAEHAPELISKSGTNGIYYEPRSSCGRMPNNSFHVTWLPSATYQEAKYAQQTSPQITSLVRHADRYGLRSDAMNAQEIHMKHRPETPLLLGQHKMLYVLGPLPYSTTKQAVTKILKAWNWDARPLQPRGRSQDGSGIQWTIQATGDPSHWIYVLQHGDVLISKVQEERQIEPPAAYSIVASKRTMLHLNQSDQSDPWLLNDPWKQPAKKTNGNVPPASMNLPPSVLASIETNVEKRLLATLTPKVSNGDQDMHMEGESIECRVSQLEQQLMQVQAGQASIEQRIGHAEYHQDMDAWYRRIWEDVESYANQLSQITSGRQLQAHQRGRAATTEVVWSDCQVAPVKPNRRGDIQATLECSNMMHARWTKQVRRLQHFSRLAGSAFSVTVMEHRTSLWRKIRLAPGFQDDFCTWWSRQTHVFQNTPQTLPLHPPDAEVATQIYLEFSRQYRELEHSLRKARTEFATTRRKNDPMLIYKDIQRDKAEPVQTIVQQSSISITHKEVKPDACIITLQEPLPEGMTTIDVEGIPVQHTPLSKIQIALPPAVGESIGDKIVTRKLVGDIPAILDAFEEEWAPRWRRHDNVNDEVWSEVLAFLKAAIPKGQTTFPPITPELWNQTLKGKRKAAAIGPDGVSKIDLQSMPSTCLDQLLCLLREVEAGQPWPTQTTTGTVAALAKVPGAEVVQQFRPICIFSMTYRVWSSVRARQCLRYLQQIVPSTLMGNIPGRSPKKIWFHIQQCIEHSYGVGEEIAGTNIDLVKCFNTLPRAILQDLAAHVGLPSEVMVPWTQALRQITRRFQIRGATGRPIPSSTGYPEGCALSVVAMVVCNIGLEVWMYHRYPRAQVWSFVDNIEALARAARDAIDAMRGLSEFCTMLDIKVDQSKSYCWSTSAEGRRQIVDEGINRKYHCRDLGGHMNYSRQATNATIQDKIHACQPFWNKLARSCAPVVQKERALYVAAWANIFYGISTVTLGSNHYAKLRTLATKSLNLHQMGSSPALQLSCISHPCTDPELYCVLATILSFRDFQTPDLSDITLRATSEGNRTVPGPCKSFLAAIHKLAWTWHCNDHCTDQDGMPIFFMRCPRSELSERVISAWQQRILAISEHERTTMQGLSAADARLTKEVFRLQPSDSQGLLRCALNGTQFTQDALCYAGKVENPKCKFCGKVDSIHHRHANCSFFEDIRAKYPIVNEATNLPSSALCHGWIPRPQHLHEFRRSLLRIPDMTGEFIHAELPEELQYVDLFLDGSCLRPHDPFTRLASWGVVVWNSQSFVHIACGGVPGWKQTSLRAEITACIAALKYLAHGDKPGRLWIDNQQVYHCISTWLNGNDIQLEKKPDADLWILLRDQYRQSYQFVSSAHKVSAHANPDDQCHHVDMWATQGNDAADRCAAYAMMCLPVDVLQAVESLLSEITYLRKLGRALHDMITDIGARALQSTMPNNPLPPPAGLQPALAPSIDAGILQLSTLTIDDVPRKFHVRELQFILDWIKTLVSPSRTPQWVSFHQLLVDYQMFSNRWGPASSGPKWIESNRGEQYQYKLHVQWFSRCLKGISKSTGQEIKIEQRRPTSHVLAFWCGMVQVSIDEDKLRSVDDHYKNHCLTMPARQIERDLQAVPPGERVTLHDGKSSWPYADSSFDVCLLLFVLHHIRDAVETTLREAARVARRVLVLEDQPRTASSRELVNLAVQDRFDTAECHLE